MKVSQYIINQAKKAGVTISPEDLVIIEALDGDVPPTVVNLTDAKLMTIEAAESNTALKNKMKAEALNPADAKIDAILEMLGASDEQKTAIKAAPGTYARIEEVGKLAKSLLDAKPAGDGKGKEEHIKEIERLNADLAKIKTENTAALAAKDTEFENRIIGIELNHGFSPDDYGALPESMPVPTKQKFVSDLFNQSLIEKGYVVKKIDGKLELRKPDGSKVYNEANVEVSLSDFRTGVLTQHQTRKVSDVTTKTTEVTLEEKKGGMAKSVSSDVNDMEAQALAALPKV